MKTYTTRSLLTAGLAIAALGLAACSDRDRAEIKSDTSQAVDRAQAAMSNAWADVKDFSYDKKEDFVASSKAMTAKLDAEISELRAKYAGAKADASREAAWNDLTSARVEFDEKMSALGRASADTWEQAKRETIAAWDRVEAAYKKARAD